MVANEVQEELVDPEVVAQFGMEGCGEEIALADEDRIVVAGGEGFDLGAGAGDAGGADEDHLEWAAFEFGGGGRGGADEGLEGVEEVVALEELEHGGGLAAWHDEAVDAGEFFGGADELGGGTEGLQGLDVRGVCALEGEDAYGEGSGHG